MDKKPILSIVVPTKDRYYYLKKLIELITGFGSNEIELVIQDNTEDNSEMLEYLNKAQYGRLKYFHLKEHIPISDNSTQAILNSTGEYVCFIGDDDGVLPSITDVAKYMKSKGIDALLSSPVTYDWPDFGDNSIYQLSSTVQYRKGKGDYKELSAEKEIKKCLKSGIRDLCLLPRVYQGIVRRDFLDKVYQKTGTYFPGGSPDMANAIALALLNPKVVYFDAPLIISGQCRTVGGGERLRKRNNLLRITEKPSLPCDIAETWDDRMPRYWCADTIWPQSAISAYKAMAVELPNINFNQIMATFIFDHPSYYKECKSFIANPLIFAYYFAKCFVVKGTRFIYWHLSYLLSNKKKRAGVFIKRDIKTINEAVVFLNTERSQSL